MIAKSLLALSLLTASLASAQEAISTAANAPEGGAPLPSRGGPLRLPDRYDEGADNIVRTVGPCGAPPKPDGKPDRSPHGEVFAGVGTRGYREAGGVVCAPLGDHASATIAIDAGHIGRR